MDAQRQIRENTLELNEFLKDLKGWERAVKEKEKSIQGKVPSKDTKNSGTSAPPRNLPATPKRDGNHGEKISSNDAEVKKAPAKDSKSQAEVKKQGGSTGQSDKSPACHTYDHFRDKWDNYDVDAALKDLDAPDEDEDGRPVKKAPKREIRPPRGSQPKTRVEKLSEGRGKASPVSPFPPPGKVPGGRTNPMGPSKNVPGSYGFDDAPPNAASEKDLGNAYFKEGKYVRAIDCYSRSIALEETAVAYANRAMAEIKIRRFADAEVDCTEAIALDDRYTKAYARRGNARKELKKYHAAVEDLEFALRLEPDNKELKQQYTEVEELYQKERGGKPLEQRSPLIVKENVPSTKKANSGKPTVTFVDKPQSPPKPTEVFPDAITQSGPKQIVDANLLGTKDNLRDPLSEPAKEPANDRDLRSSTTDSISDTAFDTPIDPVPPTSSVPIVSVPPKQTRTRDRKMAEVVAATQAAAARAAASATAAVSRNIVAPRSSYEFELMWKGFEGNKSSQVRLLKVTDPMSLPKVFKDSLSAPLLLEIIQSLELLFAEDAALAVQILENLAKVGRFNMTVMFLTSKDKTGLRQLWEQVFMKSPQELQKRIQDLRSVYRLA